MAKSFLNQAGLPLGLRNNNPGNLRPGDNWKGMTGTNQGFVVFENIAWGIRAMATDIAGDIKDDKMDTLRKLITTYAPPIENDTNAYIRYVSDTTGLAPDAIIPTDRNVLKSIIRAHMEMEMGKRYADMVSDADIDEGLSLMKSSLLDYFKESAQAVKETVVAVQESVVAGVQQTKEFAQKNPAKSGVIAVLGIGLFITGIAFLRKPR